MKDHSKSIEERSKYVLSYKVKDNKLICNMATGESLVYDYSVENENKIKKVMEKQATDHKDDNYETNSYITYIIVLLMILALFNLNLPVIGVCSFLLLVKGASRLYATSLKNDIEKLNLFLESGNIINDNLDKPNIKAGISKKTKKIINNGPIDINTLDKVKLRDYKKLLLNIKREELFNIEEINSPKVYSR